MKPQESPPDRVPRDSLLNTENRMRGRNVA